VTGSGDAWAADAGGSFEEFYVARYAWAVRLAYALTGDSELAEDIAQDVFERVGSRFSSIEHPVGYVRTSVVNAVRSHQRRVGRTRRLVAVDVATPGHLVEFADALNDLPARQRTVIVLRYLEDLDDERIAGALGCRPSTVRSLASRGLARLREAFGDA
jgi:DNA-directed RNA polymerase specialized sigma24 family protein